MRRNGFTWNGCLAGIILVCVVFAIFSEDAQAIPSFARKYKTSCATCHEAFPRLNAIGETFRLNGFKFADDEMYIKEEPVELGDEAYKKVWPEAIWPSHMPYQVPVAVQIINDATFDTGGTKDARSEFVFPRQIELYGAGALGDDMSAFFEVGFSREGGHGGHGESEEGGTETDIEGWIQFEDFFNIENAFNLRIGTVGMQEMGLFTARDHNRFSINPYLYSSWSMPGLDHHFLEDDLGVEEFEGNPFMIHAQPGIEINGFGKDWRYAVGVVNGNMEEVNDNNSEKDVYLQLAYKIGGLGFDGSGGDEDEDLLASSESWRDDSLTLSFFAYRGAFPVMVGEDIRDDQFWRFGPGLLWRHGDLQLGGGYIVGENDRPFGIATDRSVKSCTWFVETQYFVFPWLIPYARYETLTLDFPSGIEAIEESFPDGHDQRRVILGAKAMVRANVSLSLEGRFFDKNEGLEETNDGDQIIASLTMAF